MIRGGPRAGAPSCEAASALHTVGNRVGGVIHPHRASRWCWFGSERYAKCGLQGARVVRREQQSASPSSAIYAVTLPHSTRCCRHCASRTDITVNLGDICASPLWPRETFERLASLKLPTVWGNHDRWMGERPREKLNRTIGYEFDQLLTAQSVALGALPATLQTEWRRHSGGAWHADRGRDLSALG